MREKVDQFWELLSTSGLLPQETVQNLLAESKSETSQGKALLDDLQQLTSWLTNKGAMTEYQASVLAAGRATNFLYGEYQLLDRVRVSEGQADFLARHTSSYCVLLKFLQGDTKNDALRWRAVRMRGDAIAECQSPHLLACFQTIKLPQHRMVVCEVLSGKRLEKMLPAKTRLPADQAFPVGLRVALGLQQLHEHGITHKAISTETVRLVSKTETQLIVDPLYVDANWLNDQPEELQAAVMHCRAPEVKIDSDATLTFEQETSASDSSTAADLYSLGALLFRMTAGKNVGDLPQNQIGDALRQRELPDWFINAVENLVSQSPEERMSATDLVEVFEANGVELPDEESIADDLRRDFREAISKMIPAEEVEELEAPQLGDAPQAISETDELIEVVAEDGEDESLDAQDRIAKAQASIERRQKLKWLQPLLVLAGCLALGAIFAGVYYYGGQTPIAQAGGSNTANSSQKTNPTNVITSLPPIAARTEAEVEAAIPAVVQTLVPDDGSTIWETPTLGAPIDLDYLPPAPKIILHANTKQLLALNEGQLLFQSMGESFSTLTASFENSIGVPLADVDQLLISYHQTEQPQYQWFAVVTCSQSRDQLKAAWGDLTVAKSLDGKPIYEGEAGLSYFFVDDETVPINEGSASDETEPSGAADQTEITTERPAEPSDRPTKFLVGQIEVVRSVVDLGFGYPVSGSIKTLQRSSDGERHLSLMFLRPSLFNDRGQYWMGDNLSTFNRQLSELIPDEVQGGMLSFHADAGDYFEVILDRRVDISAEELETRMQKGITDRLQSLITLTQQIPSNEYWQALQNRFAGMLMSLTDGFRWSSQGRQLVGNVWLPPMAAHNLIAASELVAAFQRTAIDPDADQQAVPQSLAELLQAKRDLDIANPPDLNVLMADLEQEINGDYSGLPFKWRIVLVGADLEKDGITKNQRPGPLKLDQKSFADVLTSIVVSANPDKNISGASDPNCKLIWVVAPDPENSDQQAILITTRAAAKIKSYELPDPFVN